MTKFRRKASRTARRSYFKVRSKRSGGHRGGSSIQILQPGAMLYGIVRPWLSQKVASMVPVPILGTYLDEAVMGVASWGAAKYGSGIVKDAGMKGLTVENYRVGEGIGAMVLGGSMTVGASSVQMYG